MKDCSKALSINPQSAKAFYRSGLALMALDRVEEALDCCTRCLSFDKDNKGIQTLFERATTVKAEKDRKENERLAQIRKKQEDERLMRIAFRVR